MRPDLGHVEDVPLVGLRILGVHDLDIHIPHGIVTLLNMIVKILDQVIWVLSGDFRGRCGIEVANALLGLDMNLDVLEGAVLHLTVNFLSDKKSSETLPLW